MDKIHSVVIGVGINGNLTDSPEDLREKVTRLQRKLGHTVLRVPLAAVILGIFEKNYEPFCIREDLTAFVEDYNRILIKRNRQVRVLKSGKEVEGTVHGVNSQGKLLVETREGAVLRIYPRKFPFGGWTAMYKNSRRIADKWHTETSYHKMVFAKEYVFVSKIRKLIVIWNNSFTQ